MWLDRSLDSLVSRPGDPLPWIGTSNIRVKYEVALGESPVVVGARVLARLIPWSFGRKLWGCRIGLGDTHSIVAALIGKGLGVTVDGIRMMHRVILPSKGSVGISLSDVTSHLLLRSSLKRYLILWLRGSWSTWWSDEMLLLNLELTVWWVLRRSYIVGSQFLTRSLVLLD